MGSLASVLHAPDREALDPRELALRERLQRRLGAPLRLTVTGNRHTMLSSRLRDGVRAVRLHRMFLDAPGDVVDALARYLAYGDRDASAALDRYIAVHRPTPALDMTPVALRPVGNVHDLGAIERAVRGEYLPHVDTVPITWGRRPSPARRGRASFTLRLGAYRSAPPLIRVHPVLDHAAVPEYFVAWVVFHELLHHVTPMPAGDGRRCLHGDEFRARERAFRDRERALTWERDELPRLLSPTIVPP